MLIVNKENTAAYNLNYITNFYMSSAAEVFAIKVRLVNTHDVILGQYSSENETKTAFKILLESICKADVEVVNMPNDSAVEKSIREQVKRCL